MYKSAAPFRIMFICHGNICRSPMAEFIMKDLVRTAGLEHRFQIASSATSTEEIGNPVYPPAQRELRRHGTPFSNRAARQFRTEEYKDWDLLICMDRNNLRNLARITSDQENKVRQLMDYTERPGDVADPWYTDDFATTWDDIHEGCSGLLKALGVQSQSGE